VQKENQKMNRLLLMGIVTVIGIAPPVFAAPQAAATPPAQQNAEATTTPAGTKSDPQQYLATAKQLVDAIPANAVGDQEGQKKLAMLRDNVTNLLRTYQKGSVSRAAATATGDADGSDWRVKFGNVEHDLAAILGGGSSTNVTSTTAVGTAPNPASTGAAGNAGSAAAAGTASAAGAEAGSPAAVGTAPNTAANGAPSVTSPQSGNGASPSTPGGSATAGNAGAGGANAGAVGTTAAGTTAGAGGTGAGLAGAQVAGLGGAVSVEDIGVKNLDNGVRRQLEQVRSNIELFYDATTRVTDCLACLH
jgi:hypothetical protein